ncbi:MAG: hypothetical protein HY649_04840 [Acidobacteria bacterium]|nr:hypothetical protein [Acidobacteriota bacterium]
MNVLLLGVDPPVKKFFREHIAATNSSKVRFQAPSIEGENTPCQGRWDLIIIDWKTKAHAKLVEAIQTDQIEGLKIVLTEKENLHSALEFWGTGIYSYFLKPINRQLFQLVWQNALERIELIRKLSRLQKHQQKEQSKAVEHQQILEDLFMAHLKMQELEQEKTRFLAQTAHELGTPLTALQGYLNLLASEKCGSVTPLQLQMVNSSLQSTRRLIRLTQSLMYLSVPGGYRNHLQLKQVNMMECVQRAAQDVHSATEEKNLKMVMECAADLPPLRFDFDRMQQVFVNLLDNAVKFTPEGGKIHVRCSPYFWERRTIDEVLYASRDRRRRKRGTHCNSVRIDVQDTGSGIPAEFLQDIFQEYARGANGNGSSKGFGLGLAVARQIVAAHEGKIWAESEPGSGSSFTVLIPTRL